MPKPDFDLVVVGAGPVGLTTALLAQLNGLSVLVVEKDSRPVTESRAIWIHPRTLEIWQRIGMAELALNEGRIVTGVQIHVSGNKETTLPYVGQGLSAFPFGLMLEQSRTQSLLFDLARSRGIEVRWDTEMKTLSQGEQEVLVGIESTAGQSEDVRGSFLVGADGGSSIVRKLIGVKLHGGTYDDSFFVADVLTSSKLDPNFAHLSFSGKSTVAALPLPGIGRFRLIGNIIDQKAESKEAGYGRTLSKNEVTQLVTQNDISLTVDDVGWTSTYRSHHRVATKFHSGRVLLAGDAAHLHSPAGGLGMNTGVADALSAITQICMALKSESLEPLFAYSTERSAVAHGVINTSDRLFLVQADSRQIFAFIRNQLLPKVIKLITRTKFGKTVAFKVLSGTSTKHRVKSKLSRKSIGKVQLGARLPLGLLSISNQLTLRQSNPYVLAVGLNRAGEAKALEELARRSQSGFYSLTPEDAEVLGIKGIAIFSVRGDDHVVWLGKSLGSLKKFLDSTK